MKAARFFAPHDVRVVDVPIPEPRTGEVILRVAYNGICGSDLHAYLNGAGTPQEAPHPLTGHQNPTTLGHEFSGTVHKVGHGAESLSVGQRVVVEPVLSCGACEQCYLANYSYCLKGVGPGLSVAAVGLGADGGLGEYVAVPASLVHPIPDTLPLDLAALAEPTAVVNGALKRAGFTIGDDIAVLGAGPIGLLLATLARVSGAGRIFISDVVPERRAKARELGFVDVVDPTEGDPVAAILGAVPNGVDKVFDCAGVQASIDMSLAIVKNSGTVMAVAIFESPVTIPLVVVTIKGISLLSTLSYANSFSRVIGLLDAHQDKFSPLITHVASLDDVVEDGFERLINGRADTKVLVSVAGGR
ncbi:2,3-butanediol dehydrogenase [Aeromicrobium panaciterrae]|uniref:alcohol dehydrogenase catalytic domain-containing protein n=1 Tax=Aeromicrobium panaciterrae TaxID=363861 RepID=UPI0031E05810